MNKKLLVSLSLAVLLGIFFIASYMVKDQEKQKVQKIAQDNSQAFVRDYSISLGNPEAKVTLVEFFDPACEACKAFYPYVKDILKQYPDQVKLVLRYAPFHQGADYYAKLLEASRRQDKYWQTLEVLYQSQHYWASHHQAKPKLAWEVLGYTTLNLEKLKKDIEDPAIQKIVEQDIQDASTLKVQKTPSFFVNEKPLMTFGYQPLVNLIEKEIKIQYPTP